MISWIARLKAKKGFTIVELIVVVAIITILLAMVIPMVYYDTKPAVAKALAKDMYYKVQEVLTDCKAIEAKLPADYTCYYAEINKDGGLVEMGSFTVDSKYDVKNEAVFPAQPTDPIERKVKEKMENYLTIDNIRDLSGWLVVACDTKYRVVGSYWLENYIFDAGTGFDDECVLATGEYCCAYPLALCAPNAKTFRFSDIL